MCYHLAHRIPSLRRHLQPLSAIVLVLVRVQMQVQVLVRRWFVARAEIPVWLRWEPLRGGPRWARR